MDYKCSKEEFKICENNAKCYLCNGERLYSEPKWMKRKKKEDERKAKGLSKKKKEGMDFEKRVVERRNKNLIAQTKSDTARRRPGSGAIWSMPGDIVTEFELMECKERGSLTSKGEKTITIHKSQLEKVKQEAAFARKPSWYFIFGFKEDEDIYLTKDFQDELRLIEENRVLRSRILELENKLEEIKTDEN